jgi:mRNA-degrading endonuclease toxin of MazEF toxin-antitoxin module
MLKIKRIQQRMLKMIENQWDLKEPLSEGEFLQRIEEMQNKIKDLLHNHHVNAAENEDPYNLLREQIHILDHMAWYLHKIDLNKKPQSTAFPLIRFCIYWAYLGHNVGSEINKRRPVIVISAAPGSPLCTVIPLTTKRKNDGRWFHVDLEDHNHTAICEQLKVISRSRLHVPYRAKNQEKKTEKRKERIATISENDKKRIASVLRKLYTID